VTTALVRACAFGCTLAVALSCSRHVPRTHRVVIKNFLNTPASVVVAVGDTVEWANTDFVPHTVTARDSSWNSGQIDGSATWRLVARAPGKHAYYCVFHPNMQGTVEVR
jgi:plastocyanin